MADLYPGLILPDDPAGNHGDSLESCTPLPWPGPGAVDLPFIQLAATRLLAASHRPPDFLSIFALSNVTLLKLLRTSSHLLSKESNLLHVPVKPDARVHVVGDIHGDFHSLLEVLHRTGLPAPENILVFCGDYVDRGSWGIEVLVLLLLLKIWQPQSMFLVRGNHETSGCIQRYGFEKEVVRKFSSKVLHMFLAVFRNLPLAAVICLLPSSNPKESSSASSMPQPRRSKRRASSCHSSRGSTSSLSSVASSAAAAWGPFLLPGERRVLALHAGLFRSPAAQQDNRLDLGTLVDIDEAVRRSDDPMDSIVEDLLWSDPQVDKNGVERNRMRGAGVLFGQTAFEFFLRNNNLHGMIRAHEGPDMREKRPEMNSMLDGYSLDMESGTGFLATVFSSADYPPQMPRGNKAAFATIYGRSSAQSNAQALPQFTKFDVRDRPTDMELFYTENDCCLTPRPSFDH